MTLLQQICLQKKRNLKSQTPVSMDGSTELIHLGSWFLLHFTNTVIYKIPSWVQCREPSSCRLSLGIHNPAPQAPGSSFRSPGVTRITAGSTAVLVLQWCRGQAVELRAEASSLLAPCR